VRKLALWLQFIKEKQCPAVKAARKETIDYGKEIIAVLLLGMESWFCGSVYIPADPAFNPFPTLR
jgi:hypothetical protein